MIQYHQQPSVSGPFEKTSCFLFPNGDFCHQVQLSDAYICETSTVILPHHKVNMWVTFSVLTVLVFVCVCVQVLRQQMEALQQQFKQREGDWLLVRCQVDELIRENAKLKKKLTVAPQRDPVAVRYTAQTHTVQEGQTEVNILCILLWLTAVSYTI